MRVKIALFGISNPAPGRHNLKDPRLDAADKLVEADKKSYAQVDVVDEKESFLVKADLPGLSKDDVSVAIQDNFLTIKGERKHEIEKKDSNFYHQERVHGQFVRTIELPTRVDAGKILATFKDGVLQVTLPKSEEAKPKEIKVNVN